MQSLIYMQMSSASVSLLSSSFIATAIIRSDGGLTSPYRRIIFGLSAADILQSFALLTGPLAVPASLVTATFHYGSNLTCEMNGIIYTMGSCSTSMYMFTLCFFTVVKIKRRLMSDSDFTKRFERQIHIFILVTVTVLSILGIYTRSINSTVLGNICTFASAPAGCRQMPDVFGECDPAIARASAILVYISVMGLELTCLLGIVGFMSTICFHMQNQARAGGADSVARSSSTQSNGSSRRRSRGRLGRGSTGNNRFSFLGWRTRLGLGFGSMTSSLTNAPRDGGATYSRDESDTRLRRVGKSTSFGNNAESSVLVDEHEGEGHHSCSGSGAATTNLLSSSKSQSNSHSLLGSSNSHDNANVSFNESCTAAATNTKPVGVLRAGLHYQQPQERQKPESEQEDESCPTTVRFRDKSASTTTSQSSMNAAELVRIFRREIMLQAFQFVAAYFVTFICRWVIYILLLSEQSPPTWLVQISSLLYPLNGFFNIFVYTRPKVSTFRIRNPQYSWLRSFWLVVKAGSAAPNVTNLSDGGSGSANAMERALRSFVAGRNNRSDGSFDVISSNLSALGVVGSQAGISENNIAYRSEQEWDVEADGMDKTNGLELNLNKRMPGGLLSIIGEDDGEEEDANSSKADEDEEPGRTSRVSSEESNEEANADADAEADERTGENSSGSIKNLDSCNLYDSLPGPFSGNFSNLEMSGLERMESDAERGAEIGAADPHLDPDPDPDLPKPSGEKKRLDPVEKAFLRGMERVDRLKEGNKRYVNRGVSRKGRRRK